MFVYFSIFIYPNETMITFKSAKIFTLILHFYTALDGMVP